MFNRVVVGAVVILLAVGPVGADSPKDEDEFRAVSWAGLEGRWLVVSCVEQGNRHPGKEVGEWAYHFQGDQLTALAQGVVMERWAYRAVPGPRLSELDWTSGGETLRGICRLEGDTLTLCMGYQGKARPTKFESGQSSDCFLLVLKRQKPCPSPPASASSFPAGTQLTEKGVGGGLPPASSGWPGPCRSDHPVTVFHGEWSHLSGSGIGSYGGGDHCDHSGECLCPRLQHVAGASIWARLKSRLPTPESHEHRGDRPGGSSRLPWRGGILEPISGFSVP
jgi:uncharacterized protein (TIGR03067 family)